MGVQNMKTGPDAPGTAENEFGSAKHEKRTDALGTAENEFGRAKHENGPDALGNVKNEFESANHENGTRRTRHRRKLVRERKT
jgi:hypothetical protein